MTKIRKPNPWISEIENMKKIYVVEHIGCSDPDLEESEKYEYTGNSSNIRVFIYTGDRINLMDYEDMILTDELEYFRGELEGSESIMQYISWYLQEKIRLTGLLVMFNKIFNEVNIGWKFPEEHIIAIDDSFSIWGLTDGERSFLAKEMGVGEEYLYPYSETDDDEKIHTLCLEILLEETKLEYAKDPAFNPKRRYMAKRILGYAYAKYQP